MKVRSSLGAEALSLVLRFWNAKYCQFSVSVSVLACWIGSRLVRRVHNWLRAWRSECGAQGGRGVGRLVAGAAKQHIQVE
jgi:hypothetical protein